MGPGDTVWFAPDERHWHGADPDAGMTHLAMQEAENGVAVTWAEPVTEAQYAGDRAVDGA
jgi:quercetin dioxygenase-like cupin family protein